MPMHVRSCCPTNFTFYISSLDLPPLIQLPGTGQSLCAGQRVSHSFNLLQLFAGICLSNWNRALNRHHLVQIKIPITTKLW